MSISNVSRKLVYTSVVVMSMAAGTAAHADGIIASPNLGGGGGQIPGGIIGSENHGGGGGIVPIVAPHPSCLSCDTMSVPVGAAGNGLSASDIANRLQHRQNAAAPLPAGSVEVATNAAQFDALAPAAGGEPQIAEDYANNVIAQMGMLSR